MGALLVGNTLLGATIGCGDSGGGSIDIEASKRASANGGLQFPVPKDPSQPRANPNFAVPQAAQKAH